MGKDGRERAAERGPLDAQALFLAHAPFVASFLQRLGAPRFEVDDLVQEVFLVAHRKGGYVPGAALPRTWLAAIALRVARAGKRARNRRRIEGADEHAIDVAADERDPARAAELRQSLARVQRALDALDLEHRAAFVLYELEDQPCEAIALALGVPVGTIYSRLHHARRRFLHAYGELADDAESALRPRLMEGT